MLHHRSHRIVLVALGIIGEPLPDFIDRKDMKPLRQSVEVQAPVLAAIRSVVRAEVTAMEQDHYRPAAFLEITGLDAVNVNVFFSGHVFFPPLLRDNGTIAPMPTPSTAPATPSRNLLIGVLQRWNGWNRSVLDGLNVLNDGRCLA